MPIERRIEMPTGTPEGIDGRIVRLGGSLASTLCDLLSIDGGEPLLASRLSKAYGLHHVSSHRLAIALRTRDPMATMHHIPGPEPLRRLVKAAKRKGADRVLVDAADGAIDSFEELIREVASDRTGLDAIISAWLPDARSRLEGEAKQAIFRGMRQVKGIAAEAQFVTSVFHPGTDCARVDWVALRGMLGLRCIRPGASSSFQVQSQADLPSTVRTLDGEPLEQNPKGILLDRFCVGRPLELSHSYDAAHNNTIYRVVWGDHVGLPSAGDLVVGELRRNLMRAYYDDASPRPYNAVSYIVAVPTKSLMFDMIYHEDAYPDAAPSLKVFEIDNDGLIDPLDPANNSVPYNLDEHIEPIGVGVDRFRTEEHPRYTEVLAYMCEKLGWNPRAFRGFRARVDYPVCGARYFLHWNLPPKPEQA